MRKSKVSESEEMRARNLAAGGGPPGRDQGLQNGNEAEDGLWLSLGTSVESLRSLCASSPSSTGSRKGEGLCNEHPPDPWDGRSAEDLAEHLDELLAAVLAFGHLPVG